MSRSIRPRLYDIDRNIDVIMARTEGRSIDDLTSDVDLRYVILHALMIIAGAVARLPKEKAEEHPHIPWADIVGMGTKIKHEYHRIDVVILWTPRRNTCPRCAG